MWNLGSEFNRSLDFAWQHPLSHLPNSELLLFMFSHQHDKVNHDGERAWVQIPSHLFLTVALERIRNLYELHYLTWRDRIGIASDQKEEESSLKRRFVYSCSRDDEIEADGRCQSPGGAGYPMRYGHIQASVKKHFYDQTSVWTEPTSRLTHSYSS